MIAGPRIRIDDRKSFQRLKTTLHRRIVDAIDLSQAPALEENELRDQLRALAAHVCSREPVNLPAEIREAMVREIMDEIDGFGPLEPLLADPAVTDVLVNGPDSVRVERNGLLEGTDVRFADEAHLLRLIHRLVGASRAADRRTLAADRRAVAGRLAGDGDHSAAGGPGTDRSRFAAAHRTCCGSRSSCDGERSPKRWPTSSSPPSAGGSTC